MAKKKKKKKAPEPEINIKQKFENVKVLVNTNRPKEAIAYIYLVYDDLINVKFKKPRLTHQTIREYAINCVNELEEKLKPEFKEIRSFNIYELFLVLDSSRRLVFILRSWTSFVFRH